MTHRAFIGLGGNQGDTVDVLRRALVDIRRVPQTTLARVSPLYRSKPFGPVAQPDFVNAVAEVTTGLSPRELLSALQTVETAHGRVRAVRWGPRTLDLDILLYDDRVVNEPDLIIPHPGIAQRNFVLMPLCDIAPEIVIPGLGAAVELARRCGQQGLELLSASLAPL